MRGRAIIAISCAALATVLLAEVRQRRTSRFDLRVLASLRGRGPRGLRRLAAVVAKPAAVLTETALLALLTSGRPRVALAIAAAPSLALSTSWALKTAIDRARPPAHLFQHDGLSSFPSGHAAGTSALLWTLATACPASHPVRAIATVATALQTVLVASARISDSDHWPSDTLAGAAIGIAASEAMCLLTRSSEDVLAGDQPRGYRIHMQLPSLVSCVLLLGCGGGSPVVSVDGGLTDGGGGGGGTDAAGAADSGALPPGCTPGADVFCRCSNRDEGTKTCAADGQSFDECKTATGPCPP